MDTLREDVDVGVRVTGTGTGRALALEHLRRVIMNVVVRGELTLSRRGRPRPRPDRGEVMSQSW